LFFSHRPEQEWQNKWFVRQDVAKNREVAAAFYEHTRQAIDGSGLPVLEVNGAQQRGDDFGTRLANAVADAFAQGYERVIAVGSDCPRLHEVDWTAVADQLNEGTPVLGPTTDRDGAYLIGLRRSQFDKSAFAALPWQSPALFSALTQHLAAQADTAPAFLAPRDDVNGHGDLVALLRSSAPLPTRLAARLRSVLGQECPSARSASPTSNTSLEGRRSRAPPSLLTSSRPLAGSW
jgi:glycosyltransferase A (GT-A) superfamily protein (DUF2064 family)